MCSTVALRMEEGWTNRWLLTWESGLAAVEGREMNTRKNTVREKSWGMCEVFLQGSREVLEQRMARLKKPLR